MGYRFNFLKSDDPCYPNWVNMRFRRMLFWLGFLVWMPATLLNVVMIDTLFHAESWSLLGFVPPTCVFIGISVYSRNWRCPRCGQRFYHAPFVSNPAACNCLHCGLPEYAARDDSAAAPDSTPITGERTVVGGATPEQ